MQSNFEGIKLNLKMKQSTQRLNFPRQYEPVAHLECSETLFRPRPFARSLKKIGIEAKALVERKGRKDVGSGRTSEGGRGRGDRCCGVGDKPEFSHENRRLRASPYLPFSLHSSLPRRVSICIEIEVGEPGT